MKKMLDIYDIQPVLLDSFINYKITIFYIFLSLILIFIIYYITLNNKKIETIKSDIKENKVNFKDKLFKIDLNLDKDKFYAEVLAILKDYLEYKTKENISKMTLSELKKQNFNKKLYSLISDLYYKEYSNNIQKDALEQRKDLINKLANIIR